MARHPHRTPSRKGPPRRKQTSYGRYTCLVVKRERTSQSPRNLRQTKGNTISLARIHCRVPQTRWSLAFSADRRHPHGGMVLSPEAEGYPRRTFANLLCLAGHEGGRKAFEKKQDNPTLRPAAAGCAKKDALFTLSAGVCGPRATEPAACGFLPRGGQEGALLAAARPVQAHASLREIRVPGLFRRPLGLVLLLP